MSRPVFIAHLSGHSICSCEWPKHIAFRLNIFKYIVRGFLQKDMQKDNVIRLLLNCKYYYFIIISTILLKISLKISSNGHKDIFQAIIDD